MNENNTTLNTGMMPNAANKNCTYEAASLIIASYLRSLEVITLLPEENSVYINTSNALCGLAKKHHMLNPKQFSYPEFSLIPEGTITENSGIEFFDHNRNLPRLLSASEMYNSLGILNRQYGIGIVIERDVFSDIDIPRKKYISGYAAEGKFYEKDPAHPGRKHIIKSDRTRIQEEALEKAGPDCDFTAFAAVMIAANKQYAEYASDKFKDYGCLYAQQIVLSDLLLKYDAIKTTPANDKRLKEQMPEDLWLHGKNDMNLHQILSESRIFRH